MRNYTLFDKLCIQADQALKVIGGQTQSTERPNPAANIETTELSPQQAKASAALMRINHVGEVCAQALYQGQAFTAKTERVRQEMQRAAAEENDHLEWCQQRLNELESRPSYLNPLWYVGAFSIGAVAGFLGDKWSLGFVVETERQVEEHLVGHLNKLPETDTKSQAIVAQMKIDEAQHAADAEQLGARKLPGWIKSTMRFQAKVMTTTAYWI